MSAIAQYLLKWDTQMLRCVTGCLRQDRFVPAIRWLSRSADGQAYPAILIVIAFTQPYRWQILAACFFSFMLELGAYKLLKRAVKRPRPYQRFAGLANLIVPQDVFSFPSGHAAAAFVVASLLSYCFPAAEIPAYFWASLVGFSRIYLRVHYPTDVFAGACLGLLSARAGLAAARLIFF
jgi:undecaprenyl-diphosphatase